MGKVMKADAAVDDAYVVFDFPTPEAECWLTFKLAFDAAALAFWSINGSGLFAEIRKFSGSPKTGVYLDPSLAWNDIGESGGVGAVPAPVPATWQLCEMLASNSGVLAEFYIDGALVFSGVCSSNTARHIQLGQIFAWLDPAAVPYFDEVKCGTTRGGSEIFADDFESGTFAAWSSTYGDVSIIDDPFPPPPPPQPVVFADLPIRTFVTTKESRTISILDHRATDRQFLFTLNQPAYHTAQVASDDVEINRPFPDADSPANLTNNRRLLFALQRMIGADPPYQPLFGGIIMTPEDQGTDTPTTRYTAYDGWQYMMSRPVRDPETGALPGPNGLTFAMGSLASDIALGLLQITEIEDGETHIEWYSGDIEPSDPLPSTITFDAGLSVGEAWQQLCNTGTIDIHLDPIYEPIDLPGKINRLRIVAQSEGTAAGPIRYNLVMGWDKGGRSLMGVNRLVDGTRLANKVAYFAGQGGTAVPVQTDATSVTAYGEYWAQQFFPGSADVTIVALLAVAEMAIRRNGDRSLSADPAPERTAMPRPHELLGSYVPVWASRNLREPIGIDYDAFDANNPGASGYQRVQAVPLEVDDNGVSRIRGMLLSGIDIRQSAPPPVTNSVLKADASSDWAWVEYDFPSLAAEVWVTFRLAFAAAALDYWIAYGGDSPLFSSIRDNTATQQDHVLITIDGVDPKWYTYWAATPEGTPTGGTWVDVELHYKKLSPFTEELYIDGVLTCSGTVISGANISQVRVGLEDSLGGAVPDAAEIVYIDDVKVGTTRGGDDLFADDFESGNLSAWTTTSGDVSVVDDPF